MEVVEAEAVLRLARARVKPFAQLWLADVGLKCQEPDLAMLR